MGSGSAFADHSVFIEMGSVRSAGSSLSNFSNISDYLRFRWTRCGVELRSTANLEPRPTMTRADLIDRLSYLHPQLLAKGAEMSVRVILDAISATLSKGGRIEIRGFGSFALNYRPPRNGRNPKTGAAVKVPAKYVPHFKAGCELRKRVDYDV